MNDNDVKKNETVNKKTRLDETILDETAVDDGQSKKRNTGPMHLLQRLEPGDRILNDFEVMRFLGKGGAGAVYLVKRMSLGDLFAAKVPIQSIADDPRRRKLFYREIKTWIGLPKHPHLTTCRFIRTMDHKMIIFSEFIDGGSLTDWIHDQKLTALRDILDVSIQIVWGLKAAHESNVVHQDVKPSNVLISQDGLVKITDFGLARAFQVMDDLQQSGETPSIELKLNRNTASVSTGIMTPMFCSPEQAQRKPLDYRTDVWSWGLTVLAMFTGPAYWFSGVMAENVLDNNIRRGSARPFPEIPLELVDVLRKCFQKDPSKRWSSMSDIAEKLIEIYAQYTGEKYSRVEPIITRPPIYKGQNSISENLKEAYTILGRDPAELELLEGDSGDTHHTIFLHRLEMFHEVYLELKHHESLKQTSHRDLLVRLLLEKSKMHRYISDLDGALAICTQLLSMFDTFTWQSLAIENQLQLANIYYEKALVQMRQAQFNGALDQFRNAEAIHQAIVEVTDAIEHWKPLSSVYNAICVTHHNLNEPEDALIAQNQNIAILEMLLEREEDTALAAHLTGCLSNKAIIMGELGQGVEAIQLHLKAISINEKLYYEDGFKEHVNDLAIGYINIACDLYELNRFEEAVTYNDKAIAVMEEQYKNQGKMDVRLFLSRTYMNKANALNALHKPDHALGEMQKGNELFHQLIFDEGDTDLVEELTFFRHNEAMILRKLGQLQEAEALCLDSEQIVQKYFADRNPDEYRWLLTRILNDTIGLAMERGDHESAESYCSRALDLLEANTVELSRRYIQFLRNVIRNHLKLLERKVTPDRMIVEGERLIVFLNRLPSTAPESKHDEMNEMIRYYIARAKGKNGDIRFAREEIERILEVMMSAQDRHSDDFLTGIIADAKQVLEIEY